MGKLSGFEGCCQPHKGCSREGNVMEENLLLSEVVLFEIQQIRFQHCSIKCSQGEIVRYDIAKLIH